MTTFRTLTLASAAALIALGVGGCSRSQPDAAPSENMSADAAEAPADSLANSTDATATAPPVTEAADTNASTASADLPPAAAAPAPDQQMMDDASATGMTARASRGSERGSNEASAAEPTEIK